MNKDKCPTDKDVSPEKPIEKPVKTEDRLGRVFTPPSLIQEIYSCLKPYLTPNMRVYEPGVGDNRFFQHYPLPCVYEGCEIEPIETSESASSTCLSIYKGDFFDQELKEYDLILGNPPFRVETTGPSSSPIRTKPKQKTIWSDMVHRCFKHLKPGGYFAMVLPCIWMKPDKANIYDLFTTNRILYLKCYSCVESNKLFGYKGQTPVCYVIIQKALDQKNDQAMSDHSTFQIWDKKFIPFTLYPGHCIPTRNAALLQKSRSLFKRSLTPIKIATATITDLIPNPQRSPVLYTYKDGAVYGVEDASGLYQGVPKVLLLHKSKPFPILDLEGKYGVGGRDKYVILTENDTENATEKNDTQKMFQFLSQPIVQEILTSFTIRMNFYEKYTFDYLPCLEESDEWLNVMTQCNDMMTNTIK